MDDKYFSEEYCPPEETKSSDDDDEKIEVSCQDADLVPKQEEQKYGISKPRRIIIKAKIIDNQS